MLSEAFGAGVVLEELFVAALGARAQSRRRIFSSPARFRQPAQPAVVFAAAEVSWAGKAHPGELGFPSWGTWAFLPPLPRPDNDRGLSSFSDTGCCSAGERERLDIPSSPRPSAAHGEHGQGAGGALSHVPGQLGGGQLCDAMPPPVLLPVHPGVG